MKVNKKIASQKSVFGRGPVIAVDPVGITVSPASGTSQHPEDLRHAWFAVYALMFVYVISLIDRQILTLLVQPIQRDLSLNDTQISLLIGFAFAIFFTAMGLPIARLADRWNRRNIVAIGMVVWSVMTAACGLSHNFWQLFLARVGVGAGEAALNPSAYSMISDYFPPEKLGRAMAVYVTGLYIGAGLAMIIGSTIIGALTNIEAVHVPLLGEVRSWQITFLVVGLPGLLIALLFYLFVKEPARRGIQQRWQSEQEVIADQHSLKALGGFFSLNSKTLWLIFISFAGAGITAIGLMAWTPEFIRRTHGWPIAQAGLVYGVCLLLGGGGGALAGGWISDTLTKAGYRDAPLRTSLFAFVAVIPCVLVMTLTSSPWLSVAMLGLATFAIAVPQALSPVAIQLITPNQFRAQITALYLFFANFIVIGLGPTAVALLTDYVYRDSGALRYSLATSSAVSMILAIVLCALCLKPYRASLERAASWGDSQAVARP